MRKFIEIVKKSLIEAASDYDSFEATSHISGNDYFIFTCGLHHKKTVIAFLESKTDAGVVYCINETPVDCEFYISGPKQIMKPLFNALNSWAISDRDHEPEIEDHSHESIFHRITHWH